MPHLLQSSDVRLARCPTDRLREQAGQGMRDSLTERYRACSGQFLTLFLLLHIGKIITTPERAIQEHASIQGKLGLRLCQ